LTAALQNRDLATGPRQLDRRRATRDRTTDDSDPQTAGDSTIDIKHRFLQFHFLAGSGARIHIDRPCRTQAMTTTRRYFWRSRVIGGRPRPSGMINASLRVSPLHE